MDARLNMVMPVSSLHGWQGGSRKPAGCMPEATRDHLHSGVHTYLGRQLPLSAQIATEIKVSNVMI